MATIEVFISKDYEGTNGSLRSTSKGWYAVGTNRDTGREMFRYKATRKNVAYHQAWQYCKRHGHGMLTPR